MPARRSTTPLGRSGAQWADPKRPPPPAPRRTTKAAPGRWWRRAHRLLSARSATARPRGYPREWTADAEPHPRNPVQLAAPHAGCRTCPPTARRRPRASEPAAPGVPARLATVRDGVSGRRGEHGDPTAKSALPPHHRPSPAPATVCAPARDTGCATSPGPSRVTKRSSGGSVYGDGTVVGRQRDRPQLVLSRNLLRTCR